MILSASAILGIFAAVMTSLPPTLFVLTSPRLGSAYPIHRSPGALPALVGFNILALVMIVDSLQEG